MLTPAQGTCSKVDGTAGLRGCAESVNREAASENPLMHVGVWAAERPVPPCPASEAVGFGQLQAVSWATLLQGEAAPEGNPRAVQ